MEVYAVGAEETLEGLGALVINAEGLGIEATILVVLREARLCSH